MLLVGRLVRSRVVPLLASIRIPAWSRQYWRQVRTSCRGPGCYFEACRPWLGASTRFRDSPLFASATVMLEGVRYLTARW